jgi:hypothetical protein
LRKRSTLSSNEISSWVLTCELDGEDDKMIRAMSAIAFMERYLFMIPSLIGFRSLHFLEHFEDEPYRPFSRAAIQSQCDGSRFQDLLFRSPKVSSTADVVLDSAIAFLGDAYSKGDKLLVFS